MYIYNLASTYVKKRILLFMKQWFKLYQSVYGVLILFQ